jgi:hypothetical protein
MRRLVGFFRRERDRFIEKSLSRAATLVGMGRGIKRQNRDPRVSNSVTTRHSEQTSIQTREDPYCAHGRKRACLPSQGPKTIRIGCTFPLRGERYGWLESVESGSARPPPPICPVLEQPKEVWSRSVLRGRHHRCSRCRRCSYCRKCPYDPRIGLGRQDVSEKTRCLRVSFRFPPSLNQRHRMKRPSRHPRRRSPHLPGRWRRTSSPSRRRAHRPPSTLCRAAVWLEAWGRERRCMLRAELVRRPRREGSCAWGEPPNGEVTVVPRAGTPNDSPPVATASRRRRTANRD